MEKTFKPSTYNPFDKKAPKKEVKTIQKANNPAER